MVAPIRTTTDWTQDFDTVIDVRSPAEFADDHIPAAINLPVLSNDQRAEVGTIYKQVSPFEARRLGARLISGNIAAHLGTALKDKPAGWRPLVYCWRGGQRSGSMARVLAEIGWVVTLVEGGYKTYRHDVTEQLDALAARITPVLIQGPTGSAKTHILNAAAGHGAQVIDLEGLARHRGSLLGFEPDQDQPSQRMF
ncbi:MAG: tRNA 2-selenouridine(34) synthase MnmH, partial [Alphaproteobacteria bacterium]|nr:tRNA 2-selenouridine(34) synthase MnmH [Alphaproteobacteria bacterium]